MFIDVTRPGGRALRLAIAAIGYLDLCDDGGVVRLIGGESLRVEQTPEEVESRIAGAFSAVTATLEVVEPQQLEVEALAPAQPRSRGKTK